MRWSYRSFVLGLCVAGTLAGRPARAQIDPKVYCLGTSCYAAAFQFTDYLTSPVPYTLFSVYVQNLQGSFAGTPDEAVRLRHFGMRWVNQGSIDPIGVYHWGRMTRTPSTSSPYIPTIIGNVGVGTAGAGLAEDSDANLLVYRNHYFEPGFGIIGCSTSGQGYTLPIDYSYQTCAGSGLTGWLRLDFELFTDEYSQNGQPLGHLATPTRFTDFQFSFGPAWGNSCNVGLDVPAATSNNCQVLDYAVVTPEPATMGLVALGLAGTGWMGRRRRRQAAARARPTP